MLDPAKPHVLEGAEPDDIRYVLENLREHDIREARAFGHDPDIVLPAIVYGATDVFTAFHGGAPVFIFGTHEVVPGVRQLFGFGTERTHRVMPVVTWFTRSFWLPELFENGVRRIQAHVPDDSIASIQWLQSFGMFRETTMVGFAVDGSMMVQLAFTQREYDLHVHFRKIATSSSGTSRSTLGSSSEVVCGDTGRGRDGAQEAAFLDQWVGGDDLFCGSG
jgi:hypothetical protein